MEIESSVVGEEGERKKLRDFFIIRKFMLWKVSLNVESCGSHYLGVCSVLLLCWAHSRVRVAVVESIHDWLRCYNCLVLIVCLFVCIIGLTWLSSMLARSSAAVYSIHWSARRQWFNSTMRCVYIYCCFQPIMNNRTGELESAKLIYSQQTSSKAAQIM